MEVIEVDVKSKKVWDNGGASIDTTDDRKLYVPKSLVPQFELGMSPVKVHGEWENKVDKNGKPYQRFNVKGIGEPSEAPPVKTTERKYGKSESEVRSIERQVSLKVSADIYLALPTSLHEMLGNAEVIYQWISHGLLPPPPQNKGHEKQKPMQTMVEPEEPPRIEDVTHTALPSGVKDGASLANYWVKHGGSLAKLREILGVTSPSQVKNIEDSFIKLYRV